jgi:transposase-like protein
MSDTVLKPHKRWTAQRKFEVSLEIIKGSISLDEASRLTKQPAYQLSEWRDELLQSGAALFKEAETPKEKEQEEQITKLKTKVGEQAMEVDLLYEKVRRLENGVPFHLRKLKK